MLYNISPGANHIALEIGGYNAVVADKGEGLNHDLSPIARVRLWSQDSPTCRL